VATMYYCVRSCTSPGLSRVQGRRYTGKRAGRCGEGKGNGGINLVVKLRRSARAAARPAGSRLTAKGPSRPAGCSWTRVTGGCNAAEKCKLSRRKQLQHALGVTGAAADPGRSQEGRLVDGELCVRR
jgi:hypothetical protein